ncbi:hypothetical protein F0562_031359 [Nyssa sinensis]|uniref:adenylate kinase n=1 Tax=Nyssa sinensis TaxID=561372 RepID=A0A5J5AVP1_9ASTE|nr:hypothetical protein F0562_031359 [Nyssa sinensis]
MIDFSLMVSPEAEENRMTYERIIGAEPNIVLFFDCPEEEMVKRVLSRNQGRVDDNIDTIKKRLKVFTALNLPVINYYSQKGKLYKINAVGTVDEIFEQVRPVFAAYETNETLFGRRSLQLSYSISVSQKTMAKANLPLLAPALILSFFFYIAGTAESTVTPNNFIKASCSATTYPALCVQSLSIYATAIQKSPRQLAQTALSVSLTRAESTKTFVTKLTKFKGLKAREYQAIKDCLEEMNDTVDRLSQSVRELKNLGKARGPDFLWHMSNVQTWVSAALTDGNTCMEGFAGRKLDGRIKSSIRARVTNVAQVTSNALALVNQFAAKY